MKKLALLALASFVVTLTSSSVYAGCIGKPLNKCSSPCTVKNGKCVRI